MPVILPDPLIKAARERKLVLFVGSGLSVMAGYPGWPQLIDRLVEEAKRAPTARTEGLEAIEARGDYQLAALAQRRITWLQVLLSFIAVLLAGLGVNVVSGEPGHWSGWVLVSVAAVLEGVIFVTGLRESRS